MKLAIDGRRILLLNVGLNETLYPTLGQYSEEQDLHNMTRVIELLRQLLDCIPQVSVPAGSRAYEEYQRQLTDTLNGRKAGL